MTTTIVKKKKVRRDARVELRSVQTVHYILQKNSTHINQKQKQTPTREVNNGIYRKHDVKD